MWNSICVVWKQFIQGNNFVVKILKIRVILFFKDMGSIRFQMYEFLYGIYMEIYFVFGIGEN